MLVLAFPSDAVCAPRARWDVRQVVLCNLRWRRHAWVTEAARLLCLLLSAKSIFCADFLSD